MNLSNPSLLPEQDKAHIPSYALSVNTSHAVNNKIVVFGKIYKNQNTKIIYFVLQEIIPCFRSSGPENMHKQHKSMLAGIRIELWFRNKYYTVVNRNITDILA